LPPGVRTSECRSDDLDLRLGHAQLAETLLDCTPQPRLEQGCLAARNDEEPQARAVLDDLELDHVAVAHHDAELQGVDADAAAVAGRQLEQVVGAALDRTDAAKRAAARARGRLESHRVGKLEADQRLCAVEEAGHEEPGARVAVGHRASVLVDVLHDRHVLEQMDALALFAFRAPQAPEQARVERHHEAATLIRT
jgi:hypothetical protein